MANSPRSRSRTASRLPRSLAHRVALAALPALALAPTPALAQHAENALLIIDPRVPDALHIGNVYAHERRIPASNILYMQPHNVSHLLFSQQNQPGFVGSIAQRTLAGQIDFIIIAPPSQFFVPVSSTITDQCFPVSRLSVASAYTLAPVATEVLAGQPVTTANRFFSGLLDARAFKSSVAYLGGSPSTSASARSYYLGSLLGWTGANGNTPAELVDMIERSADSDGTRPAGTFYFMNNTADPARNVRAGQFQAVVNAIIAFGKLAQIIQGVVPTGASDALGILTGTPTVTFGSFTILDGSFADHLTSFAATFDTASQTKVSAWIANNASASAGTVEEPCNYTGKFPHARILHYHLQGATIAEAWFRSVQFQPYQGVLYGDALARAHAHIPSVSLSNPPAGPVSGTIQLNALASTTRPGASINILRTFIDGVKTLETAPNQPITINTTTLADGWHELRIVAHDDTLLQTPGSLVASLIVDNTPLSFIFGAQTTTGDLGTTFGFAMQALNAPTAQEIRLVHNGRVVAAFPGSLATPTILGHTLGAGPVTVHAEALLADNTLARSEPIALTISPTGSTAQAPEAFAYTKLVRTDDPIVVELPANVGDKLAQTTWTVAGDPYMADILWNSSSAFAVIDPLPGAHGSDTFQFQASNPDGTSQQATVTLRYTSCPADVDRSGSLNVFDYILFGNLFAAQSPVADFNRDLQFNVFDYIAFGNAYAAGCP